MRPTYVTGFDGSPASRAAIDFAAHLAEPARARIVAVGAYARPDDRAVAVGRLELLSSDLVSSHVAMLGRPEVVLEEVARHEDASLIVIGRTGRALGLRRTVAGGVAGHLLHRAPCAVAVVPAGEGERAIADVAVAFDGSEESWLALAEARTLAERHHAALHLVSVLDPLPLRVAATAGIHGASRIEAEELARHAARVNGAQATVRNGDPVEELLEVAQISDLLVCGSRSFAPAHQALAGGLSRALADRAACPVLITPRSAGPARPEATG